jgi:formate dehydrogenase subunit gamma
LIDMRFICGSTGRLGPRELANSRFARTLFVLISSLTLLVCAHAAVAQSSVRPPGQESPIAVGDNGEGRIEAQGAAPITDIWRDARKGRAGLSAIGGPEAGVLIQSKGIEWRGWHNGVVAFYGGWLLLGTIGAALLFFIVRGRIRIKSGRSGRLIPRFSLVQRIAHWFAAVLFVLLGVTGLVLLFGRDLLLPLLGPVIFAVVASASMQAHNLFGPLFIVASLALLVTFAQGNGPRWSDLAWIAKAGGLFGGHASSHKYNAGEKSWFWWAIVAGLALSVSGLALLFPSVLADRAAEQFANLVHAATAMGFIAFGIGHMYLGTIGMEGALEGMTTGAVDENWAEEHHDLWWAEHKSQATTDPVRATVIAAARGDRREEVAGT